MSPRRKKRKLNHDSDVFDSDLCVALVHNGDRASHDRQHFLKTSDLKTTFSGRQLSSLRTRAKKIVKSWKDNGIPYGSAKYFLTSAGSEDELDAIDKLSINEIIKDAIDLHCMSCPNACVPDNHGYSGSSSTQVLGDFPASTSADDTGDAIERESTTEYHCSGGFSSDEVDEILTRSILSHLTQQQVDALSGSSTAQRRDDGRPDRYSIRRLSAHWAVRWGSKQNAMTDFCHLFKGQYPEIFGDLPLTGKTLMKTQPTDHIKIRPIHGPDPAPKKTTQKNKKKTKTKNTKKKTSTTAPELAPEPPPDPAPDSEHTVEKVLAGEYMHLGIEEGVLGTSIGCVHWYEHVNLLRRVHLVHPDLLPQQILDAIKPRDGDEFEDEVRENWVFEPVGEREPVEIEIHVNIDGVQWYKNSSVKGVPILGRIHAVRNKSTRITIPQNKPFIIGLFKMVGKPDIQDFLADFIAELRELQVPTEDRPYSIKLVAMICDAPQRCELKG
jgi:hypothetical protein